MNMTFRKRGGESGGSKLTSSTPLINVDFIYRARVNILKQLEERGFDTSDYSHFSTYEVHGMVSNNQMDMLLQRKEDETDEPGYSGKKAKRVYVKYLLDTTLRKAQLNEIFEELYETEVESKEMFLDKEQGDELIIILANEPNEKIIQEIEYIYNTEDILIRAIYMKRLLFNIIDHSLVPKHRILTMSETNDLLKNYTLFTVKQLPEISRYDPVAQAIGLRPGDVCEIIRPSKTAIQAPYYRLCV